MSTATRTSSTRTARPVRSAGLWCLGAGLVGAAQAAVVLAWSPQVSDRRYSYPFTGGGFAVAQATFFVQHLPLVLGVIALRWLPAVRASRLALLGVRAAAAGLALLSVCELVTILAHDAATHSSQADLANNLYGPPVILTGLGLLVAGAALVRQGNARWAGARWMPALVLALGVYVFFPLSPAIMESFTAGRLGIGAWMLLFAALGYGLTRLEGRVE